MKAVEGLQGDALEDELWAALRIPSALDSIGLFPDYVVHDRRMFDLGPTPQPTGSRWQTD